MKTTSVDHIPVRAHSSVNHENYAKRAAVWNTFETIGYLYRAGILDIKTIFNVGGQGIWLVWRKFKPILEEYRKWEWTKDYYGNFEYLANVLSKMQEEKDAEAMRKTEIILSTHVKQSVQ